MRLPEPGRAFRGRWLAILASGVLGSAALPGCSVSTRTFVLTPPVAPDAPLVVPNGADSVAVWVSGGVGPMAGRLVEAQGERRFEPLFPWLVGVTYELRVGEAPGEVLGAFRLPDEIRPRPRCLGRDPGAEVLPENLLRLYLRFSAPMARGEVSRRVRLLDAVGVHQEHVFLDLPQELWNPEGTRLTLLFDPGRVKRGLRTHRELGRALEEGERYVLVLEGGWPDVHGATLGEEVRLPFAVGPADTEPPDPSLWTLRAGTPGTREPLRVRLRAPADRDLLVRLLRVEADGHSLPGEASVDGAGLEYVFVPARPWPADSTVLVVPGNLEDWAGHRPGRPFELHADALPAEPLPAEIRLQLRN